MTTIAVGGDSTSDCVHENTKDQSLVCEEPMNLQANDGGVNKKLGGGRHSVSRSVAQYRCDVCRLVAFPTFDEALRHEETCGKNKSGNKALEVLLSTNISVRRAAAPSQAHSQQKHSHPPSKQIKATLSNKRSGSGISGTTTKLLEKTATQTGLLSFSSRASSKNSGKVILVDDRTDAYILPSPNYVIAVADTDTDGSHDESEHKEVSALFEPHMAHEDFVAQQKEAEAQIKQQLHKKQKQKQQQASTALKQCVLGAHFREAVGGRTAVLRSDDVVGTQRRRPNGLKDPPLKRSRVDGNDSRNDEKCTFPPKNRIPFEVLFPQPSHSTNHKDDIVRYRVDMSVDPWWHRTLRYRQHDVSDPESLTENDPQTTNWIPIESPEKRIVYTNNDDDTNVQVIFSSVFTKPPKPLSSTTTLWADKYYSCTTSTKLTNLDLTSRQKVLDFVQEWKQQRYKMLERMTAKQIAFQSQNSKRKKVKTIKKTNKSSSRVDDDDWIWDGSDHEGLGPHPLPKVLLLTGAVGCGKTNLVHSVAEQCHCPLIEISTCNNRGGAALRKAMEEATQSLSSRVMLNSNAQQDMEGTRPLPAQSVDSDDSEVSMSEADVPTGSISSSLTLILIDEVDNIFERDGDSGFWTVLGDLIRRSKCPILLTANRIPDKLERLPYAYRHVHMTMPDAKACADSLLSIAQCEGFCFQLQEDQVLLQLQHTATLFKCDLRRLIHEMQLFSHSSRLSEDRSSTSKCLCDETQTRLVEKNWYSPIRITTVAPRVIAAQGYVLVSIQGHNFTALADPKEYILGGGYPVEVLIGHDQVCPRARILDDTTIVAVCPPYTKLNGSTFDHVDTFGYRSLSVAYPVVTVRSFMRTGRLKTSEGTIVSNTDQDDEMTIPFLATPITMERHWPAQSMLSSSKTNGLEKNSDDETEFEFTIDESTSRKDVTLRHDPCASSTASHDLDWELVSSLLKEGIDAWCSRHGLLVELFDTENIAVPSVSHACATDTITEYIRSAELNSDAALLEDIGMDPVPNLSGSMRGFGYTLTESYPKATDENSKRPKEDRLFTLGWKDDCGFYGTANSYVTFPSLRRDQRILKWTAKFGRGMMFVSGCMVDDENNVGNQFIHEAQSEEDMFLSQPSPAWFLSLPSILRNSTNNSSSSFETLLKFQLLEVERLEKMEFNRTILDKVFHHAPSMSNNPKLKQFLESGWIRRIMDPLLPLAESSVNHPFLLDYVPILRCMAFHDHAAALFYQRQQQTKKNITLSATTDSTTDNTSKEGSDNGLLCITTSSRPMTRSSQRKQIAAATTGRGLYRTYFDSLLLVHQRHDKDAEKNSTTIVDELIKSILVY